MAEVCRTTCARADLNYAIFEPRLSADDEKLPSVELIYFLFFAGHFLDL